MTAVQVLLSLALLTQTTASDPSNDRLSSYTPCPQVPSLHCRNGSTCIAGEAKFNSKDLAALGNPQTQESGYHCECLPGYIGHECQIEVSACGDFDVYDPTAVSVGRCYHGSQCKRSNDEHYCDCASINAMTASTGRKFAGLMCEHEATSMCAVSLVETHAPNGQFCTNHGKCVKLVTGNDPHPGCVCREGWKGDRCEFKSSESSIPKLTYGDEGGGSSTGKWVLFSLLIIAMSAVAISVIWMLIKIKREQSGQRSKKALGKTPAEVRLGDLEPDGSATLGQDSTNAGEAEGDLEMKETTDDLEINETIGDGDSETKETTDDVADTEEPVKDDDNSVTQAEII